ncbi:dicarboxylate/amino acid:cation symporter [Flavobacterium gawalongense]|uniref:Cation:dicarboxylase symporter family transporter n=1 Tax=Flavobacterium gawalongense TaxID=2594432 RepID=A0A553BLE4_9FLAO|nr:cation:dicarboxylase symporter family transporter [Flavobacterium gawalongense]TRX00854.1 cation:dicarboxylase symporter family transporter [Flavobacterium gawalongense]TRX05155.1 cation:dicarboxylase symporter family transporter [Flavobacterium gawalongense]TRX09066.1 cation:dicarboxylase symporter family transporter [Flavobacterium gawalongense]TRX10201.1 cation:dicarboxylase symporter family transporter [Flavobacterium gawalongense]TRX27131.1 cation:dicarboxylase symporter family transpo
MTTTTTKKPSFFSGLTGQILIAMFLGAVLGIIIHNLISAEAAQSFSGKIKMLATVFIRLVQMIISPLVFTTLVVGIAKLGDIKAVGRIGGKALAWFFTASFISLLLGMFFVNILEPGVGLNLTNVDLAAASEVTAKTQSISFENFIEHIVPKSIFEAMATNEILQIVIFSIFFGLAAAALGDYVKPVVNALDKTSHIVLKMVNYVMKFAPIGVFGAIAGVFAVRDFQELAITYFKFFGSFLIGISSIWVVLILIGYIFLKSRMTVLLKRILGPIIIAFGTTSSEAVFPKLTEELERFGVKDRIVSFMLPLGYSFNLDGSMMYMTFASIFIAQAYGIDLDLGTQMTMLLVLMLTSKGIAGVPRASLVVVAATCGMFDIPIEGIALILPIDHFCDMFRSATNVLGNALATSVVGQWEVEDEHEIVTSE